MSSAMEERVALRVSKRAADEAGQKAKLATTAAAAREAAAAETQDKCRRQVEVAEAAVAAAQAEAAQLRSEVASLRAAADDAAQREAALEARLRAVASEHEYVALCMASHGVVVCVGGSPGGGWLRCSTRSGVLFHGCSTSTTCRLRRLPVVCSSVFAGRCHTHLCRTMNDAARHCKRRERSWSSPPGWARSRQGPTFAWAGSQPAGVRQHSLLQEHSSP